MSNLVKRLLAVLVVALAGFGAGLWVSRDTVPAHSHDHLKNEAAHPLLAKRIFVEDPNDVLINFTSLREDIRKRFEGVPPKHSFYFEYLPTGTTIRVNGDTQLVAASLIKLPLIMNLYHAAELGRVALDDKVTLTASDLDPGFGDLYQKGAGTAMTLRELAKLGLTESDNTATRAINRTLDGKLKGNDESLPWLDVDYKMTNGEAVVSAREYSSFLKCLYLACYLEPKSSQEILDNMTQSRFEDRVTKYLPDSVKVAHKIGVFNPQNVHSDCGIFYVPKRQYVLCMMMEGDEEAASEKMAELSKTVYDWVSSR
jgi:beta-lactamase class A